MGKKQQVLPVSGPACAGCGNPFEPARKNQRHCNEACKQVAYRKRQQEKRNMARYHEALRNKQQQRLIVVPCTIDQANGFVRRMHRHHGAIPVARLAFAVVDESSLVRGVAIVGRPCNTHLDDEWTLEVRRMCTDGCPNACSALYAAAWKAAKAIGYRRLVTYTLPEEGGASLRAVGWKEVKGCGGKRWNHKGRTRQENPLFLVKKSRWEIATREYASSFTVVWPPSPTSEVIQEELPPVVPSDSAALERCYTGQH